MTPSSKKRIFILNRSSDDQIKVSPQRSFLSFLKQIVRFGLMFVVVAGGYLLVADLGYKPENAVVYQQEVSLLPLSEDELEITQVSNQQNEIIETEEVAEDVKVIDSAKLDVELIEQTLKKTTAEISKHAEQSIIKVYPNANGILLNPQSDEPKEKTAVDIKISDNPPLPPEYAALDSMDTDDIEATYEEDLPEGEYQDEIGPQPKGYHVYHGHKKLRDMEIDISHKPPYFGDKPVIAIVIDDMGISHARTRDISSLKAPITSSFLTYGTKLEAQIEAARAAGHEIIAHVPMQAKSNVDVAPDVLTIKMTPEEISRNFTAMLDKFQDIKGVNNHMGSLFTEHADKLAPVMEILGRRGLYFLDSKTSPKSVGRQVAGQYNVAYAHRHVFLDNVNEVEYVNKQLALTERIARRNGYAVAIGHPKSATYQALKAWLPGLKAKQIRLLPLSEVVKVLNPKLANDNLQAKTTQASMENLETSPKPAPAQQ